MNDGNATNATPTMSTLHPPEKDIITIIADELCRRLQGVGAAVVEHCQATTAMRWTISQPNATTASSSSSSSSGETSNGFQAQGRGRGGTGAAAGAAGDGPGGGGGGGGEAAAARAERGAGGVSVANAIITLPPLLRAAAVFGRFCVDR